MSDDTDTGLETLQSMLDNRNLPPVHSWNPSVCRDIDMRIARNGEWFYKGSVISRNRMVKLFSTVLRVDDDGHTYLVTPHEKLKISVEDAPFTAVLLNTEGQAEKANLFFTTNVGDVVLAGAQCPVVVHYREQGGEPAPYVLVRDKLQALISRTVFIQLAELAVEKDGNYGVYSNNCFMPLGSSADDSGH